MATYAIGDIQGCMGVLERLLDEISYDPARDRLWFTGDLVNRGPRSAQVLDWITQQGDRVVTVLGNHDIHLLAIHLGVRKVRGRDTLDDVLRHPRRDALLDWLRHRPLLHREGDYLMVHAGLKPRWSTTEAVERAAEAESWLKSEHVKKLLRRTFDRDATVDRRGDSSDEGSIKRAAETINVMTRIRLCALDGTPDYNHTCSPRHSPPGRVPWYAVDHPPWPVVIFGHWALHGLHIAPDHMAIDTGAVWGRYLTAIRLEDRRVYQVTGGRE